MKHRFLVTALASVMLLGGFGASASMANAATHPGYSTYWDKTRTVIVKKKTVFHHLDALKHHYTGARKIVYPGQKIKIRAAGEFIGWTMPNRPGSRYWWVCTRHGSSWIKEYHKTYKEGWNGNTFQASNGTKFTINSLQTVTYKDYNEDTNHDLLVNGSMTNHGKNEITPADWLDKNLMIYPTSQGEDDLLFSDEGDGETLRIMFGSQVNKKLLRHGEDDVFPDDSSNFTVVISLGESKDISNSYTFEGFGGSKKVFNATSTELKESDEDEY